MPKTKKSIVFCHGLWADGSCFSKLIIPLQAEGYECIATQHGLNTTAEDVALTKATIGRVSNPVILVGHSYGGSVITGAGTDDRGWTYLAASGGHQVFLRRSFGAGAEARLGDPRRAETRSFRGKSRGNCLEVEAELVISSPKRIRPCIPIWNGPWLRAWAQPPLSATAATCRCFPSQASCST